jgi:hypothetical protein
MGELCEAILVKSEESASDPARSVISMWLRRPCCGKQIP